MQIPCAGTLARMTRSKRDQSCCARAASSKLPGAMDHAAQRMAQFTHFGEHALGVGRVANVGLQTNGFDAELFPGRDRCERCITGRTPADKHQMASTARDQPLGRLQAQA